MSKLTLLAAGAAGYVLGARAGRERYEQIASTARTVMRNPKVQAAKQQAQDTLTEQASVAGSAFADKAKETASAAADKVRRNGDAADSPTTTPTGATTTTPTGY
jgi:hypothetical protein